MNSGEPAPHQEPITFTGDGTAIVRDDYGNARGGVRLPELEVPIAQYQASMISAGGTIRPFEPDLLRQLYPTHDTYQQRIDVAAQTALDAGVITPARAQRYREEAARAHIPPTDL